MLIGVVEILPEGKYTEIHKLFSMRCHLDGQMMKIKPDEELKTNSSTFIALPKLSYRGIDQNIQLKIKQNFKIFFFYFSCYSHLYTYLRNCGNDTQVLLNTWM
jgi:hypothetical protein